MSKLVAWLLCLGLLAVGPAAANPGKQSESTTVAEQAIAARAALLEPAQPRTALQALLNLQPAGLLDRAVVARAEAEGALALARIDPTLSASLAGSAEKRLDFLKEWLQAYGISRRVHDFDEPAWIRGQPDTVANAVLAWTALQRLRPDPERRLVLAQFAQGLRLLERKNLHHYPWGAHASFLPGPELAAYAPAPDGSMAPGSAWILENSPQVLALVEAGKLLGDNELLASAEREGMAMLAHVVTSGKFLHGYLPRPQEGGTSRGAELLVSSLMSLYRATGKSVYAILAGVASRWAEDSKDESSPFARKLVAAQLQGTPALRYRAGPDLAEPFSYQVMDAENGKAVIKAFDVMEVEYPGGFPGKLVTVGREQMFWMRFDLDREDEYYFYLACLKTTQAGLVSIAMRIDGDKIFQVELGGAPDSSYVDLEFVAGPRHLRSGPHSFGIRFSGLLMKQPAILDAVVVQPVVERRLVSLSGGQSLLLLKNLSPDPVASLMTEVDPRQAQITAADGQGNPVQVAVGVDKKGRKRLTVPAGGVVALQFATPARAPEEDE